MKQTGYEVGASVAVAKLDAALQLAAVYPGTRITAHDNVITRVFPADADTGIWEKCVPGGFFIELQGETPDKLLALTDETVQTLTVYGIPEEQIAQELIRFRSAGIDRIVPVGRSLDFELVWDGYDLIRMMSRRVSVI